MVPHQLNAVHGAQRLRDLARANGTKFFLIQNGTVEHSRDECKRWISFLKVVLFLFVEGPHQLPQTSVFFVS